MLLKEINHGGVPEPSPASEPPSTVASPIKPLNCTPILKETDQFTAQRRDFNSSSDTYVSDSETAERAQMAEPHLDLFTRNFEQDSSIDYSREHSEVEPPQTQDLDAGNAENENEQMDSKTDLEPLPEKTDGAASPNKSIMKNPVEAATTSPKKNVAFLAGPDLQTVHSYPGDDSLSQPELKAPAPPMVHLWTGLEENSLDDTDAETTQPPMPPPHSSHTVTGLLSMDAAETRDEPDISQLTEYKLTHKNFSNLSLNEKIDVFLSNKPHDDLNEHLDNLGKAAPEETDVNIHRLSYQLAAHEPEAQENPLNALTHGLEYRLSASARSSQSSLQSLVDSNKYLQSNHIEKQSKGLQLNDGIKGFSDKLATEIIPNTLDSAESSRDQLHFEPTLATRPLIPESLGSIKEDLSASFNQSQTEKSIMNLLESVSQINLVEKAAIEPNSQTKESPDSEHGESEASTDAESEHFDPVKQESFIKAESGTTAIKLEPTEPMVKSEPSDSMVKSEPNDEVAQEASHLPFVKSEDVSEVKQESDTSVKLELDDSLQAPSLPEPRRGSEYSKNGSVSDALPISAMIEPKYDAVTIQKAISAGQVKLIGPLSPQLGSNPLEWKNDVSASDTIEFADESGDIPRRTLDTKHHTGLGSPIKPIKASVEQPLADERDSSVEKTEESVEAKNSAAKSVNPVAQSSSVSHALTSSDYDSSVLANSSNVQPPFNIKLPAVELSDSEFDDLNKKINEKSLSYEESLSAEHDAEKKSLDFLSIWHSQHLKTKAGSQLPSKLYQVPSLLFYNTADLSQCAKFQVPKSLKPKKFPEVNVLSTKVVSLSYENLFDSGFLPELSQDSGIEDHFDVFFRNISATQEENIRQRNSLKRRKSTSSDKAMKESASRQFAMNRRSQPANYNTLRPRYISDNGKGEMEMPKRSRFTVPSFEIKRSSSILSPKNMYNDIFLDHSSIEPTIKATGMKTLPSMDKDQIRKIMDMKEAITQTGTSKLKAVGKTATPEVKMPTEENKPQIASIHCDSLVSNVDPAKTFGDFPHVVSEIITKPIAIKSNERIFEPITPKLDGNSPVVAARERFSSNNPFLEKPADNTVFPDPDPELIATPMRPAATGLKVKKQRTKENGSTVGTPNASPEKRSPIKQGERSNRGSPIKINSPVKLVKKNGSVTGVVLDRNIPEFNGVDIKNTVNNDPPVLEKKSRHTLSTVSVPTIPTADCLSATAVELMAEGVEGSLNGRPLEAAAAAESRLSSSSGAHLLEKGKLFLRVMGLKNVKLPDLNERNMSFNITLDNGVHCVKTPDYTSNGTANVPIGKEFELTVNHALQFILTLKASYDKPKDTLVEVKERRVVQPKKRISRLFGSKEVITTTKFVPKEATDSWKNLFAVDGLFARCYVDLEQYLTQVSGTARNFNLTCFNEWATIPGSQGKLREPYSVAQLEVKMLFVPRTEPYEILPLSIKAAYECLDEIKKEHFTEVEGYLHQEGGDCDSWKKRWFKLQGTSLVAHSEYSHKTRAKINLTKVTEVVYVDQENITRSSNNYRNFSDILLMEHAFKIRFADGEIIDFGAPNKQEKAVWIQAIQEIVYRNKFRRLPWVNMMLSKNR